MSRKEKKPIVDRESWHFRTGRRLTLQMLLALGGVMALPSCESSTAVDVARPPELLTGGGWAEVPHVDQEALRFVDNGVRAFDALTLAPAIDLPPASDILARHGLDAVTARQIILQPTAASMLNLNTQNNVAVNVFMGAMQYEGREILVPIGPISESSPWWQAQLTRGIESATYNDQVVIEAIFNNHTIFSVDDTQLTSNFRIQTANGAEHFVGRIQGTYIIDVVAEGRRPAGGNRYFLARVRTVDGQNLGIHPINAGVIPTSTHAPYHQELRHAVDHLVSGGTDPLTRDFYRILPEMMNQMSQDTSKFNLGDFTVHPIMTAERNGVRVAHVLIEGNGMAPRQAILYKNGGDWVHGYIPNRAGTAFTGITPTNQGYHPIEVARAMYERGLAKGEDGFNYKVAVDGLLRDIAPDHPILGIHNPTDQLLSGIATNNEALEMIGTPTRRPGLTRILGLAAFVPDALLATTVLVQAFRLNDRLPGSYLVALDTVIGSRTLSAIEGATNFSFSYGVGTVNTSEIDGTNTFALALQTDWNMRTHSMEFDNVGARFVVYRDQVPLQTPDESNIIVVTEFGTIASITPHQVGPAEYLSISGQRLTINHVDILPPEDSVRDMIIQNNNFATSECPFFITAVRGIVEGETPLQTTTYLVLLRNQLGEEKLYNFTLQRNLL
ncbi:MAG: hypothetical protein WAU07_00270 [Microgenomates group bacterium]